MEETVSDLRPEIVKTLRGPQVLQCLIPHIISQEDSCSIKTLYYKYPERANHKLLDALFISKEPGKWRAFLEALDNANYSYLVKLLKSGDKPPLYRHQKRILEAFTVVLERELEPRDLVDSLLVYDTITEENMEEILAIQGSHGPTAAAALLLDRIQCHLDPVDWYRQFLYVLIEQKRQDLVNLVDPDFIQSQEYTKMSNDPQRNIGRSTDTDTSVDQAPSDLDISRRLEEHKGIVIELMNITEVVHNMDGSVLDHGKRSNFLQRSDEDPMKASKDFIEFIIASNAERELVRAFRSSGFQYLANLLTDPERKDNLAYLRKLIQVLTPRIQHEFNTLDVLDPLIQQGVIGQQDKENIQAAKDRYGEIAAARLLLDCIPRRLEPKEWYIKFLRILAETKYDHVVQIIEPDFLHNQEMFMEKFTVEGGNKASSSCSPGQIANNEVNQESHTTETTKLKESVLLQSKKQALQTLQEEEHRLATQLKEQIETAREAVEDEYDRVLQKLRCPRTELKSSPQSYGKNSYVPSTSSEDESNEEEAIPDDIWPTVQLKGDIHIYNGMMCTVKHERRQHSMFGGGIVGKPDSDSQSSGFLFVGRPLSEYLSEPISFSSGQSDEETIRHVTHIITCHLLDQDEQPTLEFKATWTFDESVCMNKDITWLKSILQRYTFTDFVILSDGRIAGFIGNVNGLLIIDIHSGTVTTFVPYKNEICLLKVLNADTIVGMPLNEGAETFPHFSANDSDVISHTWSCEHARSTIAAHNDVAYVICKGKDVHMFRMVEGKSAESWTALKGVNASAWNPTHSVLNDDGSQLYVADAMSHKIFCFELSTGEVLRQYEYECASATFAIGGMYFYNSHLFVYDREDRTLKQLSMEDGTEKVCECRYFKEKSLVVFDKQNGNIVIGNRA